MQASAAWGAGFGGSNQNYFTKEWINGTTDSYARNAVLEPANVTVMVAAHGNGSEATGSALIAKNYTTADTTYGLVVNPSASLGQAHYRFILYNGASVGPYNTAGGVSNIVPFTLAGTYDGTTAILYQNGFSLASAAVTGPLSYDTSSTGNLYVANFRGGAGASNQWVGNIYWAAVWNRVLSAAEVYMANSNIWQLIRPLR